MTWLERSWYRFHPVTILLLPFAWCFSLLVRLRRFCYRWQIFSSTSASVPVIVVGNLTVGGNGKTPFVLALVAALKQQGHRPGIVLRGYGAKSKEFPRLVSKSDSAIEVGDEALLLARRSACPVAIAPKRPQAVSLLVEQGCTVIISDDGLQHYAMARDIEIVVVDKARQFGNGLLLPAGPLRESRARLSTVDFIIENGADSADMQLVPSDAMNLVTKETRPLSDFANQSCHALAGIGHPERFFTLLAQQQIEVQPHPFPDHHSFRKQDLTFEDEKMILMTEKDAVKCADFASERCWAVPVTARLSDAFITQCLARLDALTQSQSKQYDRRRHPIS